MKISVNTIDAVKQILLQSGASWVLWLLGALSLVSVQSTVASASVKTKGRSAQHAEAGSKKKKSAQA